MKKSLLALALSMLISIPTFAEEVGEAPAPAPAPRTIQDLRIEEERLRQEIIEQERRERLERFPNQRRFYVGFRGQTGSYSWEESGILMSGWNTEFLSPQRERETINGLALTFGMAPNDFFRAEMELLINQVIRDYGFEITTGMFMFNFLFDFPNASPVTPFAGFGLGALSISYRDSVLGHDIEFDPTFAFQLLLGTSVEVSPWFSMEFGAKFKRASYTHAAGFLPPNITYALYKDRIEGTAFFAGGRFRF